MKLFSRGMLVWGIIGIQSLEFHQEQFGNQGRPFAPQDIAIKKLIQSTFIRVSQYITCNISQTTSSGQLGGPH
eukprot:6376118-Amphidinium_carterae.1